MFTVMCRSAVMPRLLSQDQSVSQKLTILKNFRKNQGTSFFIFILLYFSEKVIPTALQIPGI